MRGCRCRQLEAQPGGSRGPLWGVPFAVKDNIDALPFPTTAACGSFRYTPAASAPTVKALEDAGARLPQPSLQACITRTEIEGRAIQEVEMCE